MSSVHCFMNLFAYQVLKSSSLQNHWKKSFWNRWSIFYDARKFHWISTWMSLNDFFLIPLNSYTLSFVHYRVDNDFNAMLVFAYWWDWTFEGEKPNPFTFFPSNTPPTNTTGIFLHATIFMEKYWNISVELNAIIFPFPLHDTTNIIGKLFFRVGEQQNMASIRKLAIDFVSFMIWWHCNNPFLLNYTPWSENT